MAAGKGTRISRHIDGKPKCTVEIKKGQTLIEHTIKSLIKKGIKDITIILGYRGDVIKEVLKEYNIKYYENPFYDVTNSIASLWFAKEELKDEEDILFMNGDVFFEEHFIDIILKEKRSPVLYSDEMRIEEADYRFKYENGILKEYGKELSNEKTTGEYIGVARIEKEDLKEMEIQLNKMIKNQDYSLWWENILYSLSNEREIYIKNVKDVFWAEVDYIEDYQRIKTFLEKGGN